jgi:protein TonB
MATRLSKVLRLRALDRRQDIKPPPLFHFHLSAAELATASGIAAFSPQDRLTAPKARPRWHPWAWAAALLLHLLVIAALLFHRARAPVQEAQSPPAISVVFANGGAASEATAPPVIRQGPPQEQEAPNAAAPPPPPPPQAEAMVNLNMPSNPLAELPRAPQTPPQQARQTPAAHPRPRPALPQHYVMMDGMSYGNPASHAAPAPSHGKALNFSLPQNDVEAVTGNDFAVRGNAGADWDAALRKWVEEHAYYPQAAIEQEQQGTAEVEFTVDRQGHVTNLRLLRSAGSPFLDQAWELLFTDNQLPPFPADAKDDHVVVDYTVHYRLLP